VTTAVDWSHAFNPGFVRGNLRALNDSGIRYAFAMNGAQLDGSDIQAAKAEFIDPNPLASQPLFDGPGSTHCHPNAD
jgi:5-methylthioadenosine/S-adenosylhomocysteine deaminase